jgi:hypothetical protein
MKRLWLLTLMAVSGVATVSWAMAQDTIGADTQTLPGQQSSSISVGSYGEGLYGRGLFGPGSYGPGSYGRGVGAATGPATPFGTFSLGGAAAGTVGVGVPSAPSR